LKQVGGFIASLFTGAKKTPAPQPKALEASTNAPDPKPIPETLPQEPQPENKPS
jgi:hypothetical protein